MADEQEMGLNLQQIITSAVEQAIENRASQLSATTQPLPELQASRPALPSIASPPSNSSSLSQMPPSLSSQNRTVRGRKRTISDILKKGKQKAPRLVSWDKNIVCLPEDYCGNNRVIPLPKGRQRASLAARGLCGKIRVNSEMTEEEVLEEVRSVFKEAMGNDSSFPFRFLQVAGGGSKSLTIPVLSASYTWTAREVVKMAGQGCLYIQAQAALQEYNCDREADIDLPPDQEELIKTQDLSEGEVIVLDCEATTGDTCVEANVPDTFSPFELGDCDSLRADANLKEILVAASEFLRLEDTVYEFEVRRHALLNDCLKAVKRKAFHPTKRIKVVFVGELGEDLGGPSRELWRLFGMEVAMSLCHGPESCKTFKHNSSGLKDGKFFAVGQLMGCSLINGGSGYPFLSPPIYQYIAGTPLQDVTASIQHVPTQNVKAVLDKIIAADDEEEMRGTLLEETECLLDAGCSHPIHKATLDDKSAIVGAVALHHCVLSIKAELDQLKEGLEYTGLLQYIHKFPKAFESVFTSKDACKLTAESILELFPPMRRLFSEAGSSARIKEENTYIHFRDLLDELETGDQEVQLEDVMTFWSGASSIPPMGFFKEPQLSFSDTAPYPTASTCALKLVLPTSHHDNYDEFKAKCLFALQNHGGFGLM